MPWRERSIVSVRKDFILLALAGNTPKAELCRQFGVSRKTGYKWLKRFKEKGTAGLVNQSKKPRSNSAAISSDTVMRIVQLKHKHPTWGAKKLLVLLLRERRDRDPIPSVSTINRILYHSGLVTKRRRYRKASAGLPERPQVNVLGPNDLWTVDFKGWWKAGDGTRCEPLTVRDAYSRFVLELRLLPSTKTLHVRRVFEELFKRWGLPKAIQSDNGPPFASLRALGGLTQLSAWWLSLGIEVVRSRPGTPTDNGAHERMHADVSVEIQAEAAQTRKLQQAACDEWRAEFNHVRPHEALGMKTPGDVYKPSSRQLATAPVARYVGGMKLVRVDKGGHIATRDRAAFAPRGRAALLYLGVALAGYQVGLDERDDGYTYVWFYDRLLGRYARSMAPALEPMLEPAPNVRDVAAWQAAVSVVASATSTSTSTGTVDDTTGAPAS
jgi:transposase InsO family protein